jgi:hypothetical protein
MSPERPNTGHGDHTFRWCRREFFCEVKFHAKVSSLIWRALCGTRECRLVPGGMLFSRVLTWALNNPNDIQHALLTKLDANALRRARPEFFQLAHEATRSGIRNRLGIVQ